MKKFLLRLKVLLENIGFKAEFDGWSLIVNGAKFTADSRQGSNDKTVVQFLDSDFVMDKAGHFNEAKALGKLLQELPKRIARNSAQSLAEKLGYTFHGGWHLQHGRFSQLTEQLSIGCINDQVALVFLSKDEVELRRIIDMFRDSKHKVDEKTENSRPQENADASGNQEQQAG